MSETIKNEEIDFFSKLFSFKGSMKRQEYLLYGVIIPLALTALGIFLVSALPRGSFFLLLILLGGIIQIATSVKRGRDRGENIIVLIIALLLLAPITILYLLVAPSKTTVSADGKGSKVLLYIVLIFLAVIIVGNILAYTLSNQTTTKISDNRHKLVCLKMKGISQGLKLFKLDNDVYPTTEEHFDLLFSSYLREIPTDSWGNEIQYVALEDGFELISLGADGMVSEDDITFSGCEK